ncbi:unnamed protein product [Clavelina lepadiformis]|uniref:Uncharacterized protein n=1 Tax=Clavelina lepadiformis TaxID=159417 RepID=A0ABP0F051_CLALP
MLSLYIAKNFTWLTSKECSSCPGNPMMSINVQGRPIFMSQLLVMEFGRRNSKSLSEKIVVPNSELTIPCGEGKIKYKLHAVVCYVEFGEGKRQYITYIVHEERVVQCEGGEVGIVECEAVRSKIDRCGYIFFFTKNQPIFQNMVKTSIRKLLSRKKTSLSIVKKIIKWRKRPKCFSDMKIITTNELEEFQPQYNLEGEDGKVFCNVLLRRLREAVDYIFKKNKLTSDMEDAVENKFSHLRNTQEQCIDFQSTLVANSIDIKKDFDCVHCQTLRKQSEIYTQK